MVLSLNRQFRFNKFRISSQENFSKIPINSVTTALDKILSDGANVNIYMFYGGTNFGFTAGANNGGPGKYNPDITSYDYDAPMDESGDITEIYLAIRDVIRRVRKFLSHKLKINSFSHF